MRLLLVEPPTVSRQMFAPFPSVDGGKGLFARLGVLILFLGCLVLFPSPLPHCDCALPLPHPCPASSSTMPRLFLTYTPPLPHLHPAYY